MYDEDDMLMLSGIQHFMFCRRQWALIDIEQQWADNRLTTEGDILHENVDNPFYRQKNGDAITLRSVHVASKRLGLYGITDAVELHPADSPANAISHPAYPGLWLPYPVEYKRGRGKANECDEVQLAAQVMCLEEMYGISISYAALYYDQVKHREVISITEQLRALVTNLAEEMHAMISSGAIPKAEKRKGCRSCSLKDICLPDLPSRGEVKNYLKKGLYEEIA